ncbi:MAG: trigger factor [Planctomycetes bacterium]|nr:trigger factor [Planctomycetota bacterium]
MAKEKQPVEVKNKVTVEDAGPCRKKVSIEIPQETIKAATDNQYQTLRKEAEIPGFRKGRAPRELLEKRFGKETSEQIKLQLLSDASDAAIKDNKLQSIGEPDVDLEKIELPSDGALKFDFELEVRPEFELPKLEGIEVKKKKLKVTKKQIDGEIEQLQKWSGVLVPREDGKVQPDDQVIADVVLKCDGVEEEEKLENIEIHVRKNGFAGSVSIEKLDELLIGTKTGDVKKTTVDVPKTYFKEEYRGKKVDVQITINNVKWLKPAEIDEKLFKKLGVENQEQLKERIQQMLEGRLEQQSKTDITEQIYKYLLKNTTLDLPVGVVAEQANSILQRQYNNLLMQGLQNEQLKEQFEQMRSASESQAKEQLKTFFIMDKIAEKFEISVSDEEMNGRIAQLAIQQGQRPEKMREDMAKNNSLGQFNLQIRESKCIDKLLESAKITEVEPVKKTAAKTAKTDEKPVKKTAKKTVKKPVNDEKPVRKTKKTTKKKTSK